MLCNACQRCFFTSDLALHPIEKWETHHRNRAEFKCAATDKCYICKTLWRELRDNQEGSLSKQGINFAPTLYWVCNLEHYSVRIPLGSFLVDVAYRYDEEHNVVRKKFLITPKGMQL
jgi:hypothetical protein